MKSILGAVTCLMLVAASTPAAAQGPPSQSAPEDELLGAVLLHDEAKVKALLEQGASANVKFSENDRTALFFAAEMGNAAIVELLIQHGADVTARDKLRRETPVGAASRRGHAGVVRLLLAKDGSLAETAAWNAVFQRSVPVLEAALSTERLSAEALSFLWDEADRGGAADVANRLTRAGALPPKPIPIAPSILTTFVGSYESKEDARLLTLAVKDGALSASMGGASFTFVALRPTYFVPLGHPFPTLQFGEGRDVIGVTVRDGGAWIAYTKVPTRLR